MQRALLMVPMVLLSGCPKLGEVLSALDLEQFKPTVSFQRMDLKGIDFDGADLNFVFKVDNPSPAEVKLASFDWDLDVAGGDFLAGARPDGMKLSGNTSSELVLPVRMGFKQLIDTGRALKGKDEIPFTLRVTPSFDTPVGPIRVPVDKQGQAPVLTRPKVNLKAARVQSIQLLQNKANIEIDLGVLSQQASPVGLAQLNYVLKLEGMEVATGALAQLPQLKEGEAATVTIPVVLNLLELGTTVAQSIKNKTKVDVGFAADMDVRTPWGDAPLQVDKSKLMKWQ